MNKRYCEQTSPQCQLFCEEESSEFQVQLPQLIQRRRSFAGACLYPNTTAFALPFNVKSLWFFSIV